MDLARLEPRDYQILPSMEVMPEINAKSDSFIYAPITSQNNYREATAENTDAVTGLNGSKMARQINFKLDAGPDECIATDTIRVVYQCQYVLGEDGIDKWIMSTDATETKEGYSSCKPKTIATTQPYMDGDGILMATCAYNAQFLKNNVQNVGDAKIINAMLNSDRKTQGHTVMHMIIDDFLNGPSTCDVDPNICNDTSIHKLDQFGNRLYATDPATGIIKADDPFIKSRKFKTGDPKTFSERIWNVWTACSSYGHLFKGTRNKLTEMRFLPPNMNIKFEGNTRSFDDRMKTDFVVSVKDAGSDPATFKDYPVYLKFTDLKITYQVVTLSKAQKLYYLGTAVLGSESNDQLDITENNAVCTLTMGGQGQIISAKPVDRRTVTDIGVVWMPLAQQSLAANLQVNFSQTDILPPFFAAFVTKMNAFNLSGLCSFNWDLQHWTNDVFSRIHLQTSGGQNASPDFMTYLNGSDLVYDRPGELELHNNYIAGQLFWNQNGKNNSPTAYVQQAAVARASWLKAGLKAPLTADNIFAQYTNPSLAILRDAGEGRVISELQVQAQFKQALATNDYYLVAYYANKANVVINVNQHSTTDRNITYSVNKDLTGDAYE